jgi:hypothetical protein
LENLEEVDPFEDTIRDQRIILKWILEKKFCNVWTGFVWLRIEIGGGLL